MVQQAIEHGGDGRGVPKELPPVLDGAIRSEERGGPLIAAHHDLQKILGGGVRELPHAQIVDDEQRDSGEGRDVIVAGAGQLLLGEILEEHMGFAVQDAMAVPHGIPSNQTGVAGS
jgi:hypothetical protein